MRVVCHPLNSFTVRGGFSRGSFLAKMQSSFEVRRETFEQKINKKAKEK